MPGVLGEHSIEQAFYSKQYSKLGILYMGKHFLLTGPMRGGHQCWNGLQGYLHCLSDQCDYQFLPHLEDIFDILSYLQKSSSVDDRHRFNCFMHRRCSRKLSWWLWDFVYCWKKSPFDILNSLVPDLKSVPQELQSEFEIILPLYLHGLCPMYKAASEPGGDTKQAVTYKYQVNSNNVRSWIIRTLMSQSLISLTNEHYWTLLSRYSEWKKKLMLQVT